MEIAVVGAGSIGCWVGGMLAEAAQVTLVGRPSVIEPVTVHGLTIEAPDHPAREIEPSRLATTTSVDTIGDTEIALLTVKSRDTVTTAGSLASSLRPGAVVVSLQNGVHNPERIRSALDATGRTDVAVLAAMVAFNVVRTGPSTFRRATSGGILVADDPAGASFVATAKWSGLEIEPRADMPAVQYAKLLLNLNNAVNALSGLPLRDELGDRDFRRVLAACQQEALAVYAAAGIRPARLTPVPPTLAVRMLRTPNSVFRTVARASIRIDPAARSSMADDLAAGRPTEVDELQGEVARLGRQHGVPTPVSTAVCQLVADAERAGPHVVPRWTGPDLRGAVGAR